MHPILFESLIILGLLLFNGVFAMSEIAVVTSRRARLEQRARAGSVGAVRALALVDEPTRFLSTVQIGITLVGVLAGAFGGATIAEKLDLWLETFPAVAPFSEAIAFAIVVGAISFVSLVVGELVPKRIAMQAPERIASLVAGPMQFIARIASPVVTLLTATTTTILRLLRIPEAKGTPVTEEEILSMISEGRQSGVVQVAEHAMLQGVFRLGDWYVRDLMVPRHDVDWVDVDGGAPALRERLLRPAAEGIVICRGSMDDVIGVIRPQQMLAAILDGKAPNLEALAEEPIFAPGSMEVLRLLETFRRSSQRVAVVLDEFGGVEGVVTMTEVLAEIVGETTESAAASEGDAVERPDGTWLLDGASDFADVALRFRVASPSVREMGTYRTVAGFVMARVGRVPRVGDAVVWDGVRFEVVDMDERRVDKVLITPRPAAGKTAT